MIVSVFGLFVLFVPIPFLIMDAVIPPHFMYIRRVWEILTGGHVVTLFQIPKPKETRMIQPKDLLVYLESGDRTEEHLKAPEYLMPDGDMAKVATVGPATFRVWDQPQQAIPMTTGIGTQGMQNQFHAHL